MTESLQPPTALLLPGMSLNHTIFPEFGIPTIRPNLAGIELGSDGISLELRRDGFDCYVRLVEAELGPDAFPGVRRRQ